MLSLAGRVTCDLVEDRPIHFTFVRAANPRLRHIAGGADEDIEESRMALGGADAFQKPADSASTEGVSTFWQENWLARP
jgi:hypothetical protein